MRYFVVMRRVRGVPVVPGMAALLMVAEGHALPLRDRGHALHRYGQRQEHDGQQMQELSRHRSRLYASPFERAGYCKFLHRAHFLRDSPIPPTYFVEVSMPANHAKRHTAAGTQHPAHARTGGNHYIRLLVMTGLSFAAMYVLMYAMVDSFASVFNSINQAYMAASWPPRWW